MIEQSREKRVVRILVCEDETVIARDVVRTLTSLGYAIAGTVSTGREALRIVEESTPDLILMDIRLEGQIDGIETAELIRTRFDLPVIFLTGYAEAHVLDRAKKTEPYGYLAKPVGLLELRSTVETALSRHEADKILRQTNEKLERMVAERTAELTKSKTIVEALIHAVRESMFILDNEAKFLALNRTTAERLGKDPSELLGKPIGDFLPPDVYEKRKALHDKTIASGTPIQFDDERGGRHFHNSYYPISGSGNKVEMVAFCSTDITERVRIEEALRQTLAEIECRVEERTTALKDANERLKREILERTQAQEMLARSQEQLQAVFDASPAAIFLVSPEGRITLANRSMSRLFSRQHHELPGTPYVELVHPDDRSVGFATMKSLMGGEIDHVSLERRYLTADGTEFVGHLSGRRLLGPDGGFEGLVGIIADITDRKRAEEALRESGALIRSISNNLPGGMIYQVVRNNDGTRKFTYLSEAVNTLYGCSPEDAMNDAGLIYGRVHEDDRHRVFVEEEEAYRCNVDFSTEVRMMNPSGDMRWSYFASSPRRREDGSTCWSGFEIDITERKMTESALRESAARQAKGEELAHIGSWEWNVETGSIVWSRGSFRAFGYDPPDTDRLRADAGSTELPLDFFVNALHPDDRERVRLAAAEALAGGQPYDIEFRIVRPDGEIRVLHSKADVLRNDTGRPLKMIGMAVDVTERRIAENLLIAQRDLSLALSGISTLDEAFDLCMDGAMKVSGMEAAAVYLVNPDSSLDLVAHQGVSERFAKKVSHFSGASLDALMVSAGSMVYGRCDDPNLPELAKQALKEEGFRCWAVIPIVDRGRVTCSIHLASGRYGEIPVQVRDALLSIASGLGAAVTRITAEESLRESEELYRVLVETTNTGYVVVAGDGRVLAANPEYVRLTGHDTVEEILGRSVVEWTAEHDRERNAAEVEKCFREGFVRNLEIDYVDARGSLVPIEINATVVADRAGRRIMTLCREISDRKRSAQLINVQRDLGVALSGVSDLHTALELCIDAAAKISGMEAGGVYVVQRDAGIRLAVHQGFSEEFVRKVEYFAQDTPETDIVKRGVPGYFCGTIPGVSSSVAEALEAEGLRASTMTPILHQGQVICSLHLASREFEDVPLHTRTAIEAMSSQIGAALSRIRAEENERSLREQLQESEQRYRQVVDLANEGIMVSQGGRLVLVNRKTVEMSGYSEEDLLALPIPDLVHPDDKEMVLEHHRMRMQGFDGPAEYVFRIRDRNGRLKWLHMRSSLVSWCGKHATLGLVSDITESKRLEEELRHSLENASRLRVEAEAASTAKSEFLATMSHELRTPLNAIIGFSELLEAQSYGDLNAKQMDCIREVLVAGHRLLDQINDVLDLAKVESGKMELLVSEANMGALLRDCLSLIAAESVRKGIVLDLRLDGALEDTHVRIDGGKVRLVVCNLLSNAVKFTPKGGRIGVQAVKDGDDLVVSVSDTGIGISPENRQRVFERFVQLDARLSRKYKGTGLGLALSKTFVELQGGRIWCESEGPGMGSTFRFRIPVGRYGPGEHHGKVDRGNSALCDELHPAIRSTGAGPGALRSILLVEDDPGTMRLIAAILEMDGHKVLRATNAEDGIRLAESQCPSLILTNITLPGMDGIAARRLLKRNIRTRHIPVIAVTAHAMEGDKERLLSEGFDGYVPKPVARAALLEIVRKHRLE
ncbi:MAG: PAS domain S-box protein [Thermodesulfobacteriota bacterium]